MYCVRGEMEKVGRRRERSVSGGEEIVTIAPLAFRGPTVHVSCESLVLK